MRTHPKSQIAIEERGHTYPEAGVITTSQQTAQIAAAIAEGFPVSAQERNIQARAEAAAAVLVTTNALAAREPEATADHALNQNHPNHRSAAPSIMKGRLFAV